MDAAAIGDAVADIAADLGVPVVSAYLFGSRARGRAHRESDVDVAILLDPAARLDDAERFEVRLALTGALIGRLHCNDVDLVLLNEAPPLLARRIVTDGRRVHCADPDADRRFVRQVQLAAADLLPFLRRTRATKLRAITR